VTSFDDDSFGHRVPFTIEYDLAPNEVVTSAVLTLGMKRRSSGSSSDDDLLWLDSTSNPLGFTGDEWGPLFEGNLQVLTLELVGDLAFLQDGQLNGVLSNNRALDWVHLAVNVVDQALVADSADFNEDGEVDGSDFLTWQRSFGAFTSHSRGDADYDGDVDAADLAIWQAQFGSAPFAASQTVPEPSTLLLTLLTGLLAPQRTGRH
jgi:hypothetical protein